MDLITQALLGAALGELMLGKRLGNRALGWGALIGLVPELERFLAVFFDTAGELALWRGPGHSLLVLAMVSFFLSRGLARMWAREKISRNHAWGFVLAVWGGHLAADTLSVGGAALMWPFSPRIHSLSLFSETDFIFTLLLVITVGRLMFHREKKPTGRKKPRGKKAPAPVPKRRRILFLGLGMCAGYGLLAAGLKFMASAGFEADLARRGGVADRRVVAPTPHHVFLWRGLVDRGDELWVGYRSVFEFPDSPVRWTVYPKGAAALSRVGEIRETRILMNFTDGWWIARPHVKGAWLGDLRSHETRIWDSKPGMVDSRPAHSWVIAPNAAGDVLRTSPRTTAATGDTLLRQGARILGRRDRWEANPRLAGVSGSLPEFLPIQE